MQVTLANQQLVSARPFLKWAGGKTQLLDELGKRLPAEIVDKGVIERYIEPFVGGGAMFFYLKSRYDIKKSYLFDINPELVIGYKAIQKNPNQLISFLKKYEDEYLSKDDMQRSELYYFIRNSYNEQVSEFDYSKYGPKWVNRAAHMIFLNKTCYNGLFRQNSKGMFNVPFGNYKHPTICDNTNIENVHQVLKNTAIEVGDFSKSICLVTPGTLIYMDPPYRPISATSCFNSYAKSGFSDDDQRRLADYYNIMNKQGAILILSNSDPKNYNSDDNFFDELYSNYNIDRVLASRIINCDATKRGAIYELIIKNY